MSERRYSEEEVAAIFASAAEPADTSHRRIRSAGLTLAELQEIGGEVGLSPADVARAAALLSTRGESTMRRFLGMPIAVGKTVELGRELSDAEWEHVVVDLRATFAARGRLETHGSLRQWSNGNLHALLEPAETGHRLRLETTKRSAADWMTGGLITLGGAASMVVTNMLSVPTDGSLTRAAVFLSAVGLGMFGVAAARLPSWARRRRQQMDDVIARALSTTDKPSSLPK